MKKKIKLFLIIAFGMFLLLMAMIRRTMILYEKGKEWIGTIQDVVTYYELREFKGKIIKKFINKKEHLHKTLILKNNTNNIQSEIFSFDDSGFYEYVEVGDSLVKKEGDLFARVYREGQKDTAIVFKFKNYETGEIFPKEYDSLVKKVNAQVSLSKQSNR